MVPLDRDRKGDAGLLTKGMLSSMIVSSTAHILSGFPTGQKMEPNEIYKWIDQK